MPSIYILATSQNSKRTLNTFYSRLLYSIYLLCTAMNPSLRNETKRNQQIKKNSLFYWHSVNILVNATWTDDAHKKETSTYRHNVLQWKTMKPDQRRQKTIAPKKKRQKEPSRIDMRRKIAKFMVVCMNVPLLNVSAPRHYLYSITEEITRLYCPKKWNIGFRCAYMGIVNNNNKGERSTGRRVHVRNLLIFKGVFRK